MKVTPPNWNLLRRLLLQRSGGRDEVTGLPLDPDSFDAHHRRPKGMGGTNRPDRDQLSNLLALAPDTHNGGPGSVHARRGWSEEHGYLLPQSTPIAGSWPVLLFGRRWVYLLNQAPWYMDVPRR